MQDLEESAVGVIEEKSVTLGLLPNNWAVRSDACRLGHHTAAFLVPDGFAGGASLRVNTSRGCAQCMLSAHTLTWGR